MKRLVVSIISAVAALLFVGAAAAQPDDCIPSPNPVVVYYNEGVITGSINLSGSGAKPMSRLNVTTTSEITGAVSRDSVRADALGDYSTILPLDDGGVFDVSVHGPQYNAACTFQAIIQIVVSPPIEP